MTVTVNINPSDIATNRPEALELILQIFAARRDCVFTIAAIRGLIDALSNDMTREEIAKELGFKP